jgi:hypothetical protein
MHFLENETALSARESVDSVNGYLAAASQLHLHTYKGCLLLHEHPHTNEFSKSSG